MYASNIIIIMCYSVSVLRAIHLMVGGISLRVVIYQSAI